MSTSPWPANHLPEHVREMERGLASLPNLRSAVSRGNWKGSADKSAALLLCTDLVNKIEEIKWLTAESAAVAALQSHHPQPPAAVETDQSPSASAATTRSIVGTKRKRGKGIVHEQHNILRKNAMTVQKKMGDGHMEETIPENGVKWMECGAKNNETNPRNNYECREKECPAKECMQDLDEEHERNHNYNQYWIQQPLNLHRESPQEAQANSEHAPSFDLNAGPSNPTA